MKGSYTHTKEQNLKISKTRKRLFSTGRVKKMIGKDNPMYGRHWNKIQKRDIGNKVREKMKGRIITWGDKISKTRKEKFANNILKIWNKGLTKETDERVEKCSGKNPKKANFGIKNGFYGKRHTEETKIIIQKKNFGKIPIKPFLKGHTPHNKGKNKIYYIPLQEVSKKCSEKRQLQKNVWQTTIELKLQDFLKQLNIEFHPHKVINIEHKYQCDIYIPFLNLIIEADGDYWHRYPLGTELDYRRTYEMKEKGYNVLRLWECDIRKMDLNEFQKALKYSTMEVK